MKRFAIPSADVNSEYTKTIRLIAIGLFLNSVALILLSLAVITNG